MCRYLEVSKSAYYDYLNHKPSQRENDVHQLVEGIKSIRENKYKKSYGTPRMYRDLKELGYKVGNLSNRDDPTPSPTTLLLLAPVTNIH